MANQEQAPEGVPREDRDRPSPDVERDSAEGRLGERAKGNGPGAPDSRKP